MNNVNTLLFNIYCILVRSKFHFIETIWQMSWKADETKYLPGSDIISTLFDGKYLLIAAFIAFEV